MPARSLFKMATTRLIKNKECIQDIGEIPFEKVKAILLKLERPEQLHRIEQNSPQILGHTAPLWIHFLKRDIQDYDKDPISPSDGKSWYTTYESALKKAKERAQEHEMLLMSLFKEKQEERDRNLATVSEHSVVPGSERSKKRAMQTTHSRNGNSSVLSFTSGSRTKTDTGSGIMKKIRRETNDHALRIGVLGGPPPQARVPATQHQSPSIERPTKQVTRPASYKPIGTTKPIQADNTMNRPTYRAPVPSANPMLGARQKRSPPQGPIVKNSADVPSMELRPSQPPERKPSPRKRGGTGVFMPPTKRKRV